MANLKNYLSLIRFSHTIFAMPFALIGFFLGITYLKQPLNSLTTLNQGWHTTIYSSSFLLCKFILVILCMIFARSAAMAFNRWLDNHFDKLNPRTAIREIPAGIIKPKNALSFTIACCILFIFCTWFINRLCFYLSPLALLVVLGYSYTKRFTALCHLVLGLGLSLAPIGAYLALTGSFALLPLLFSFTVLCWVSGFDVIYALQDEAFDKAHHLHSVPAAIGKKRSLRVSELLHLLSIAFAVYAGIFGHFGIFYWVGIFFFACLLIYQHLLISPNDLSKVNLAFFTTNGMASVVFAVFVIVDLFLR